MVFISISHQIIILLLAILSSNPQTWVSPYLKDYYIIYTHIYTCHITTLCTKWTNATHTRGKFALTFAWTLFTYLGGYYCYHHHHCHLLCIFPRNILIAVMVVMVVGVSGQLSTRLTFTRSTRVTYDRLPEQEGMLDREQLRLTMWHS